MRLRLRSAACCYGLLLAGALLAPPDAHGQTRQCVEWGRRHVCSEQWPHDRCWWRKYCVRHAYVDSYRRSYDEDTADYGGRRDGPSQCAKDDRGAPAMVSVVGLSAFDDKGAEAAAQRQWRVTVTHRFGEVYADLANAVRYKWRCVAVSTNETALGKAGEAVFGDAAVRKRCGLEAIPCKQPMINGEPPERGDRSSDRR